MYAVAVGDVCVRSCTVTEYDAVSDLSPAQGIEADEAGYEPQGREDGVLFSC